ncbi:MAG: tRNA (guanosine(37)-N1)-methyltransferase TrmD [Legionellaceae bacterium]|nr:tRNA (guanosine(37)-N1)-methyltransferase TrmD [Legionellaceae bacterium]
MLHIGVVCLMPELIDGLRYGVIGRALEQGIAKISCWNPRDWGIGRHKQVDDSPYGGGPGMVMRYEPVHQALMHAKSVLTDDCKVIYMSPQGRKPLQQEISALARNQQPLIFLAGRYEGIDERIIETHVDEEWSLGDFVISGGELAAMVFIDAIVRLLPGSLHSDASAEQDSFMNGLLDWPHYTRPALIDDKPVPEVLLQGNHAMIDTWRRQQALLRTWQKRPDLLENVSLTQEEQKWLDVLKK